MLLKLCASGKYFQFEKKPRSLRNALFFSPTSLWWADGFFLLGLLLLALLFGPGAPVRVINGRVLEQGGEHKDEAHDQVDVDGFHVADPRQRAPHPRRYRRHRQHGRYACGPDICIMRIIREGNGCIPIWHCRSAKALVLFELLG